jgi:uncharacterized membrane protein YuzA (DUF378 family)
LGFTVSYIKRRGKMAKNAIDWIALILLVIGGINWGLVALLNLDIVAKLFGAMTIVSKVIYVVIGVSALWTLFASFKRY